MTVPRRGEEARHLQASGRVLYESNLTRRRGEAHEPATLLAPGHNCWRVTHSPRAAVLIDAASYFAAFVEAASSARDSLQVLAWDFNTEIYLRRNRRGRSHRLGDFLLELVRSRPSLEVHVLCWAGAIIYNGERQSREDIQAHFARHPRLHIRFMNLHPPIGSNHEKIVVIDDGVAFVGGLDLTRDRWDTPAHYATDRLRENPLGELYRPFHDVQMVCDGETAAALGELFRHRWREVTGETLSAVTRSDRAWPPSVIPEFTDVNIGISRTHPGDEHAPAILEIDRLYSDAVRLAKRYIYFECEYLTSETIIDAIAARLGEADGPEVLIVGPRRCTGFVEESTMGSLRDRALRRLRQADRFERLRFYYPIVPDIGSDFVSVHSKVMIADGSFLHVGSANLSNRSLGLDTECDLTIEGNPAAERVLARLLGEHLGVPERVFHEALREHESLLSTVERFLGGRRTLVEPESGFEVADLARAAVPDVVDPKKPLWLRRVTDLGHRGSTGLRHLFARSWPAAALLLLLLLAAAWQWTPLGEWANLHSWFETLDDKGRGGFFPLAILGVFVLGGLLMLPLLGLITATAFFIPAPQSFYLAFAGSLLSACASYGIGRLLQAQWLDRIAGKRLAFLRTKLAHYGVIAIATLRLLPVVPFSVFNLVCGGLRVRFWDYILGTALGLLPGTLLLTLLGSATGEAIRAPNVPRLMWLTGLAVIAIALTALLVLLEKRRARS